MTRLYVWFQNEMGASAVEYGLLVALIAAVIVVVLASLGHDTSSSFDSVDQAVRNGG